MKNSTPDLQQPIRSSPLTQLGRWVYGHRIWVIVLWGLLMIASLGVTPLLENALKETGAVYQGGSAYQAEQLLQQELKVIPDPLILVFQRQKNLPAGIDSREVDRLLKQIRSLSSVSSVVSPTDHPEYRSADGQTAYSLIQLRGRDREKDGAIAAIAQILNQQTPQDLKTFLTGKPAIDREVQRISKADLSRVELFVLPLALGLLLVIFGSVVAATMPVAMGMMTVSVTFGILYLVTLQMNVSIFALNLTTMLGLGLGIDYSLLIVSRFREELPSGTVEQAITRTLATAGRSVFFSGLTVCIGLVCLMLFPILLLQSLGIAGSIVVLLSVTAALTLLPALLGLVGHRINPRGSSAPTGARGKIFWAAIARTVTRHSFAAFLSILILVGGLTAPFFMARFGLPNADILPKALPARQGIEVVQQAFGVGETAPIFLAIQTPTPGDQILSERHLQTLFNFVHQLEVDQRVASVNSLVNLSPQLSLKDYQQLYRHPQQIPQPQLTQAVHQFSSVATTLVIVKSRSDSHDAASRKLVQDLKSQPLAGLTVQVSGQIASDLDTIEVIEQRFPLVLAAMLLATFMTLGLLLRSIILPLKAIVMNLLSIGASFGSLVFIFQQGHFQTWLNFTPVGYIDILLAVVLFCVLFGLSMDYEVFLLSRIQEAYDRTGNNSESIIEGLEHTGGIITSAALLMIVVTGAFAFTSIILVKALGLGSAIAIAIDATLIRAILVPATMHLMGRWNWWLPRF
ncbi:MMPL family transporter [Neosynechococcus sphagnicola]|uniref:MMPL family transporter n=1 Tax=Neosynechococcus sphagnicola TaxID=1501145 RepID=UPI0012E03B9C|nr:MMPL family transporter [Neosynechococcus sphagnicola]